ncbi:hypothetical protein ACFPOA_09855 [Lysobacter niabensis]|uniref:hypothetical protein n=1 Tax=Agrilutibacter niabensis TaxID=380628 RepID=UPI00361217F2
MINKSMTLVIGAGASREYGLPTGKELMERIAVRLRFEAQDFGPPRGDKLILDALRISQLGQQSQGDLFSAADRIVKAMPQAPSIDNYIHAHKGDKAVELCGKLAIAREILIAECQSSLFVDRSNFYNRMQHGKLQNGWFNSFIRGVTLGCSRGDLDGLRRRLSMLKFIVFNYDRCIEHQLYNWLMDYFSLPTEEVVDLVGQVEIVHPYGMLGPLPWQVGKDRVEFGADVTSQRLLEIAGRIRTFTESSSAESHKHARIKALIRSSQTLVFLGFGYDPLNLELLSSGGGAKDNGRVVFGTASAISKHNRELTRHQLADLTCVPENQVILEDALCASFVNDFSLSFSPLRSSAFS